ncbi:MAG: MFS transporter [Candidatus Aminicenantes bacterium]|nr:MFS transporter [Candidatus Aminicenantes bacterium]
MRKRVLFSASLFHFINDASAVAIPMIFPLLYNEGFIITKYSHIGILSYLGLFITFVFQILIVNFSKQLSYKSMLIISICGISVFIFLLTFSDSFLALVAFYIAMRIFMSFYHPLGVAVVSRAHPESALDYAMGVQSGSGNFGVFIAFISVGYLAQNWDWRFPLYIWAGAGLLLGLLSFVSVSQVSGLKATYRKPDFSLWLKTLSRMKKYIPGIFFGGGCWATTVYYAPSLLNHKFEIPMGKTGVSMASWIALGTLMPYFFGFLSQKLGRRHLCFSCLAGTTVFSFLLWLSAGQEMAVLSLLLCGAFLFLIFPAFQSYTGLSAEYKDQDIAFSLFANIQMLGGAVISLASGFVSDMLGIHFPFLLLSLLGVFVLGYYLKHPFAERS